MKRLLAVSAALTILTGAFASCGKPVHEASENNTNAGETASDHAQTEEATVSPAQAEAIKRITNGRYRYEEITLPVKYDYLYNLQSIGEDTFTFVYCHTSGCCAYACGSTYGIFHTRMHWKCHHAQRKPCYEGRVKHGTALGREILGKNR